jgi:hypothetical protein
MYLKPFSLPIQFTKEQLLNLMDKGAVIALPYGVEGFATPRHLVKEDGTSG